MGDNMTINNRKRTDTNYQRYNLKYRYRMHFLDIDIVSKCIKLIKHKGEEEKKKGHQIINELQITLFFLSHHLFTRPLHGTFIFST